MALQDLSCCCNGVVEAHVDVPGKEIHLRRLLGAPRAAIGSKVRAGAWVRRARICGIDMDQMAQSQDKGLPRRPLLCRALSIPAAL